MEDLDLDELDQAVTQLMDNPKGKPAAKKVVTPKVEAPKAVPEPSKTTPALDSPVAIAVAQKTPPARPPMPKPAARKRMRPGAMDIIQRPTPARRLNREGAALQPMKPVIPEPLQPAPPLPPAAPIRDPEVSDDLLASLNLLEDSNKTVKPKPETVAPAASESWPDPIDLHDFDDAKKEAPTPELTEEPPTLQSEPVPVEEPAPSPFLTTKVEKRPLGAYASALPQPEESVEAPVPNQETSKAEMAEASLQSSHHRVDESEPDLRQMSIPQQYHTAQPKPSDTVHNVFDTKEYHAPPQPMHTERRGGPWFLISVVVLIVLIVAVAAVGYLMMTGMLDISKIW
ncbi:MAG TPA: hypothetical protein VM581_02665 [Magnetospirillaceae bacterium]|nr:hypothetical protein [Magnetospirillaceae bacterium]